MQTGFQGIRMKSFRKCGRGTEPKGQLLREIPPVALGAEQGITMALLITQRQERGEREGERTSESAIGCQQGLSHTSFNEFRLLNTKKDSRQLNSDASI